MLTLISPISFLLICLRNMTYLTKPIFSKISFIASSNHLSPVSDPPSQNFFDNKGHCFSFFLHAKTILTMINFKKY